jgi:hypothetical protein
VHELNLESFALVCVFGLPDETLNLIAQTACMARRRETYMKEAANAFLLGSRYRSPAESVEAGERNIQEWCDCLNWARSRHGLMHEPIIDVTEFEVLEEMPARAA